jgi:hypothetical protein
MFGERSTAPMLMDHIAWCPCFIRLHDRIVHVLEEFMLEAGATKGRDLRLDVRRIRLGVFQNRHADAVWLDFMAPYHNLVLDIKSAKKFMYER